MRRWGVFKTAEGGVSIGWTSIAALRRCPRRGYWSLLHDQGGVSLPPMPPALAPLYGQIWHRLYKASWVSQPLLEAGLEHLDSEGLDKVAYEPLVQEVIRDIDWYFQQPDRGDNGAVEVLACEDELKVKVGPHEWRGTPDLVIKNPEGSIVIPDHKTHGVLSFTAAGSPRIELDPRAETIAKYQASRQFRFYAMLWNQLHPDQKCYDALINIVPSHVMKVLGILNERKGNVKLPRVTRLFLEPFEQTYLDELYNQTLALCDSIKAFWDSGGTADEQLERALIAFPESDSACVGYGGSLCQYWDLCVGAPAFRKTLLTEAYQKRSWD